MASIIDLLIAQKISGKSNKTVKLEPLSVTENGEYIAPKGKGYSPVTVNVASGGSGSDTDAGGVTFIDYDGTVLHSYTKDEFAALTELPENPSHTGLTAQGWNWSLADAQTYVAKYGMLIIGQMYVTDDGKTRIYIDIPDSATGDELTFYVYFNQSVTGGVEIDWGDGSSVETVNNNNVNISHTYAQSGEYMISLNVVDGNISFNGSALNAIYGPTTKVYNQYRIIKVELGNNIKKIQNNVFYRCKKLKTITTPNYIEIFGYTETFGDCNSLKSITFPNSITTKFNGYILSECWSLESVSFPKDNINISSNPFYNNYSLKSVAIPDSVTSISSDAFHNCYALKSVVIPDSVTSIGSNVFYNCYALKSVVIPNGVTSIGNSAFYNCYALESVVISDSITSIGNSTFGSCYALKSVIIPDGVTSIGGGAFQFNHSLKSVVIPDSVTSIGSNVFNGCYALESIVIPDGVTSIGNSAFTGIFIMKEIHFKPISPPTASNSAFNKMNLNCKIYVPTGSLAAYTSASNYPDPSTYTYIEE